MKKTLSLFCSLGALIACESSSIASEPLPPLEDDPERPAEDPGSSREAREAGQADAARVPRDDAGDLEASPSGSEQAHALPSDDPPEPEHEDAADGGAGDSRSGMDTESKIAGSAAANDCTSYSEPAGEQCYGFWCGVSEAIIAAELQPGGPCSGLTPKVLCDGTVQIRLQSCAISIQTDLLNLLDSDEALRMKIQNCFYEQEELEPIGPECLSCFLEGGECAGRNCVTECLASQGRSAACDRCRFEHNCFQPLPACAGIPNPF